MSFVFPDGASGTELAQNPPASEGDADLITGSGNPLEEGKRPLTPVFWHESAMDRGAWAEATVHKVTKSQIGLKRLPMQAKGYGDKDKSKTRPISWRSHHVIDKTEAGSGDRWVATQYGSTKVEGCRVPWVHLCQCPHPVGKEEGAQSPSCRIIVCPRNGDYLSSVWYSRLRQFNAFIESSDAHLCCLTRKGSHDLLSMGKTTII